MTIYYGVINKDKTHMKVEIENNQVLIFDDMQSAEKEIRHLQRINSDDFCSEVILLDIEKHKS